MLNNFKKPFPNIKTKEDFVLWLKITKKGYKFYSINNVLSSWTDNPNSLSKSFIKIKDAFKVYFYFQNFNLLKSIYFIFILSINFLIKSINDLYSVHSFYSSLYIFYIFFSKKQIFFNSEKFPHQNFTSKNFVLPIGGYLIIIFFILFGFENIDISFIYILIIFLIGALSDLKKFNSPKYRLIAQSLIIIVFIVYFDMKEYFNTNNLFGLFFKKLLFKYIFYSFLFF